MVGTLPCVDVFLCVCTCVEHEIISLALCNCRALACFLALIDFPVEPILLGHFTLTFRSPRLIMLQGKHSLVLLPCFTIKLWLAEFRCVVITGTLH